MTKKNQYLPLLLDFPASSAFETTVHALADDPGNQLLATTAVDDIIEALSRDTLTPVMRLMIGSFLERHDFDFAAEELGLRSMGRPNERPAERMAVETYKLAIEVGLPQDRALIATYDAYFQAKASGRTFASDNAKADRKRNDKSRHDHTVAENTMRDVIRKFLRRYGFDLERAKPTGRPPTKVCRK